MRVLMLSISHRTAPVALREKLAVAGDAIDEALHELRKRFPSCEAVLLSTCNRTEFYVARPAHEAPTFADLDRYLAEMSGVPVEEVTSAAVHRDQDQAVNQLFRVATGLESMVLGEPQILGQVKRAYDQATACDAVGPVLHLVFQQAITIAKQVRNASGIDEGRVSVGSVAVDSVRQVFDHFDDKTIVAIGAGDMAKLTLRHLQKLNPQKLWLTNRTMGRAESLADYLDLRHPQGGVRPFDDLESLLVEADIVVTSTGATEPIIDVKRFKPLIRKRRARPIFIVDIAVPRDVEPRVGQLTNVFLRNIDDLQNVVASTYESRSAQVQQCETMVFESVARCMHNVQHRDIGQLIKSLRQRLHAYADAERERSVRRLVAKSDKMDAAAIEQWLEEHDHRLVNKILHLPLSQLDQRDPNAPLGFFASALRRLFAIDDGAESADELTDEVSAMGGNAENDGGESPATTTEGENLPSSSPRPHPQSQKPSLSARSKLT